jgi:4'-phosphopantetheinyl transferase
MRGDRVAANSIDHVAVRAADAASRPVEGQTAELACGVVHLWLLNLCEPAIGSDERALSDAEKARASRFAFARDRERFVAAHVALRAILARYTSQAPHEICYVENAFGKPALEANTKRSGITFSLSHTADIAVVAVSTSGSIGVDVEMRALPNDYLGVARNVFSADEIRDLESTSPEERSTAFFTCWTRKEAYLKALGVGFSSDPTLVNVGTSMDPSVISTTEDQAQGYTPGNTQGNAITVQTIRTASNFVISLALSGDIVRIDQFQYSHKINDTTLFSA